MKPQLEDGDWDGTDESTKAFRAELARYFIQRKRENIAVWMDERTPFPKRTAIDFPYKLSAPYQKLYDEVLLFSSRLMARKAGSEHEQRFRYWSALALLRGIMSSPRAGALMLNNRAVLPEVAPRKPRRRIPTTSGWRLQTTSCPAPCSTPLHGLRRREAPSPVSRKGY